MPAPIRQQWPYGGVEPEGERGGGGPCHRQEVATTALPAGLALAAGRNRGARNGAEGDPVTALELLAGLSAEERRQVLTTARRRRFAAREVLFHEGDPGDSLHLLATGRVAVRVSTPMGEIATLVVLGRGDTVGELAVLAPDGRRTATVVALERTETWSFQRDALDELRRRCPGVDRFLIETLAAGVRRLSGLLLDAMYLPVDRRVLRRLADLEHVYRGAGATTEIPLTQEDIATLAGASRATVNRVLRGAEAEGYLRLARGRTTVLDPATLRRKAGT